jgi:hypothetical protein
VEEVLKEIFKLPGNKRILYHFLSYAEFQFGNRILGQTYRERGDFGRIDNFQVEINIMIPIYQRSINVFIDDQSLSKIDRNNIVLPYYEKVLEILKPWSLCLDLDAADRVERLSNDQIDDILNYLSEVERNLSLICSDKNQFEISENHCQRSLSYARRYNEEGESKTTLLLDSLSIYCQILIARSDFTGAVTLAEEAYNCVAIAYNPVHPQVQEAACVLIECLIHKGEYYDAERFALLTLESLKDPANKLDQEGEAVAKGYYYLASVICQQNEDLVRAEMLARELLRIWQLLYDKDHIHVATSIGLLANILRRQGQCGAEVKELFERSMVIYVKHEGPDGVNTSINNRNMGNLYRALAGTYVTAEARKEYLYVSLSHYTEAFRINAKIFGLTHNDTITDASHVSDISHMLSEASIVPSL